MARLSGWTGSFVSLCLPSVVSRCLPAWMPGTALWVDGFICLPFFPLSPFICLLLSPSLDAWHGFVSGRIHLSPFFHFISPRLPAWMPGTALSQPGCLAMIVCSWCVPADHIGAFQVNTFFGNVGFQELARVAAMGFVWLSRV